MPVISDNFATAQAPGTTSALNPAGVVPTPVTRTTLTDGDGTSMSISGNILTCTSGIGGGTAGLRYNFTPPINLSADTTFDFVIATLGAAFDAPTIRVYITDTVGNGGVPVLNSGPLVAAPGLVSFSIVPTTVRTSVSTVLLEIDATGQFGPPPPGETITIQPSLATLCFPGNTAITMADGTTKHIRDVQPGDAVLGAEDNQPHTVKRQIRSLAFMGRVELMRFPAGSLGENLPNNTMHCSVWHPVLFEGKRRPAHAFEGLHGIERVMADPADVLGKEADGLSYLFNLQCDHETVFLAEGVAVQSHSPYHEINPLPKELRCAGDVETRVTCDSLHLTAPYDATPVTNL